MRRKVEALFPEHEWDEFTQYFWEKIERWRQEEGKAAIESSKAVEVAPKAPSTTKGTATKKRARKARRKKTVGGKGPAKKASGKGGRA